MPPMFLLIYSFIAQVYFAEGQLNSICTPPDGGQGICESLYNCDILLELVQNRNRTSEDVDRLRKSHCGHIGNVPAVCCPERCFTPDGTIGRCIDIHNCPRLVDLIKPSTSLENVQYIRSAMCKGPEKYSVCCGPARIPGLRDCAKSVTAYPPEPSTECCGIDSTGGNKIISVGGKVTAVDQYPWLALIEYKVGAIIKLLCGGSLISSKYVLTAAHCVTGDVLNVGTPKNVRLGEYDTDNDGIDCATVEAGGEDCTEGLVVIPIKETIPHPEYQTSKKNDIALITLQTAAPFTDFIRPICLPSKDYTLNPPEHFILFAAGWGANTTHLYSNIKTHVDLPFKNIEVCQQGYRSNNFDITLWNKQLCAGGVKGKDTCKGDSGGPLMYANRNTFEIIGVISFGHTPCGKENLPGVYTSVFQYINWIKTNVKP